jgi:hypothetical protein
LAQGGWIDAGLTMRELLGEASIGWENVDIYVDKEGNVGGSFTMAPKEGKAVIEISASDAQQAISILVHETIEFAMTRMECRLAPSPEITGGHDTYLFVMRHYQFSEVSARTSEFIMKMIPKIMAHYKKKG